jgi:hypothetical protein
VTKLNVYPVLLRNKNSQLLLKASTDKNPSKQAEESVKLFSSKLKL